MRGFVLSHRGFLDICSSDLHDLDIKVIKQHEACVEFEASPEEICSLFYRCQSATKFLVGGTTLVAETLEDLLKMVTTFNYTPWLAGKKTFRVSAITELSNFSNHDIMHHLGEAIQKQTHLKVNLTEPDLVFFVYVYKNSAYLGIDVLPFDISKRVYKIFQSPRSIKGTLAYCLIKWSGYNNQELLLDPCAGSGVIPIEAALLATRRSPHFFKKEGFLLSQHAPFRAVNEEQIYSHWDKKIMMHCPPIYCFDHLLPHVQAAQKNAKIAGVEKTLIVSKYDVEWLDIKLGKEKIDHLVSLPPPREQKKFYNEFFYQAAYLMKKHGKVTLLCKDAAQIKEAALSHAFSIIETRVAYAGQDELTAIKFQKV